MATCWRYYNNAKDFEALRVIKQQKWSHLLCSWLQRRIWKVGAEEGAQNKEGGSLSFCSLSARSPAYIGAHTQS